MAIGTTEYINANGNFVRYDDMAVSVATDGTITLRFRTPQWGRYAKLHCSFDERNAANGALNMATATNSAQLLVKAYYYAKERKETYAYDAVGRRSSVTVEHPQNERAGETSTYQYYASSELLKTDGHFGYVYDLNGNLTAKGDHYSIAGDTVTIQNQGESWTYGYDAANRLQYVQKLDTATGLYVSVANYVYNYKNERIKKTNAKGEVTRWVYDESGHVLSVTYPDGTKESLVWLGGRIFGRTLAYANGTSVKQYFTTDALGSTVLTTDSNGKVINQNDVTPFGQETGASGLEDVSLRYTGKDFDPDTGLYYYNARWYDPVTGRFTTEDPIRDGSLWYGYVGNNPMSNTDPTGLVGMTPLRPLQDGSNGESSGTAATAIPQGSTDQAAGEGSATTTTTTVLAHTQVTGLATTSTWYEEVQSTTTNTLNTTNPDAPSLNNSENQVAAATVPETATDTSLTESEPEKPTSTTWQGTYSSVASGGDRQPQVRLNLQTTKNTAGAFWQVGDDLSGKEFVGRMTRNPSGYLPPGVEEELNPATRLGKLLAFVGLALKGAIEADQTLNERLKKIRIALELQDQLIDKWDNANKSQLLSTDRRGINLHHVGTIYGDWYKNFKVLFASVGAGDPATYLWNLAWIHGHRGPHPPEYHQIVFTRLSDAVRQAKGDKLLAKLNFDNELLMIGIECMTVGDPMNGFVTRWGSPLWWE